MVRHDTRPLEPDPATLEVDERTELVAPHVGRGHDRSCVICGDEPWTIGILCGSCTKNLACPPSLCPEQIWSHSLQAAFERAATNRPENEPIAPSESHALLIDGFGRPHLLSSTGDRRTTTHYIGRDRRCSLAIAEAHVSRIHARLEYREFSGAWFLKHESKRNQTLIDNHIVGRYPMPIDSGHRFSVGPVCFFFVELAPEELGWAERILHAIEEPGSPLYPSFATQESLRAVLLSVELVSGGGVATAKSLRGSTVEVRLTGLEARFLLLLLQRREADRNSSPEVRGFMRSAEILDAELPFDTPFPTPDNLKALVRRTRRRFSSHNANDIIESKQGYGYRIQPSLDV